jgi:signal transduction histidine kinase
MRARGWRWAWALWVFTIVLLGAALTLAVRTGSISEDPAFAALAIAMMVGYASIGALVASKLPSSPIGWLLLATGLGFLVSVTTSDYAIYGLYTWPGGLPFVSVAVWVQTWIFFVPVGAVVLLVALFPTGSAASHRWRWLPQAIVAAFALGIVASALRAGPIVVDDAPGTVDPTNPLGIEALDPVLAALQWVAGITAIAVAVLAVASLVVRYRAAQGEERQQVRLLAYAGLIAIGLFLVAIATSFGLEEGESSTVNNLAFFAFFIAFGIGIPAAAAIAVIRYRLWDLDVVLKKTIVATVLVLLLMVAAAVLFVLPVLVVGIPVDSPGIGLIVGIAIGALVWPLLRLSRRLADRIVYGSRATPYEVLSDFSDRMAESYATDDVLPRMASILAAGIGAERVTIWLLVGGELRPAASSPSSPKDEPPLALAFTDLTGDAFVVRHQGEQLGALTVTMPPNDPMNHSKERLIRDLAGQAGLVLRNVRLIEELRASRRRLVAAQDQERRRLERNIHDGAQQQLVALAVKLRLADQIVERDPAKAHEILEQLQAETNDALEDLRDLARGIYPPLLADKGLAAALDAQARKSALPFTLEPDGVRRYPQEIEATIYFCVLEAMQNISKYANASAVGIAVWERDDRLGFEVRDDGVGFDPGSAPRGTGLQGMADRLDAIGGELRVSSAPGTGTTISGAISLSANARATDANVRD